MTKISEEKRKQWREEFELYLKVNINPKIPYSLYQTDDIYDDYDVQAYWEFFLAAKTSSYEQILNLESRLRDSEILNGVYESEFEELREQIRELENTIETLK